MRVSKSGHYVQPFDFTTFNYLALFMRPLHELVVTFSYHQSPLPSGVNHTMWIFSHCTWSKVFTAWISGFTSNFRSETNFCCHSLNWMNPCYFEPYYVAALFEELFTLRSYQKAFDQLIFKEICGRIYNTLFSSQKPFEE